MTDTIRNFDDFKKRVEEALANGEAFLISSAFKDKDGVNKSVFFAGGRIDVSLLNCLVESTNSLVAHVAGIEVKADSLIKENRAGSYEKNEDGSFKLTFKQKPNEEEATPA